MTTKAALSTTTPFEPKIEIGKTQMTKRETTTEVADHLFDASLCEQVDPAWCEKQGFSSRLYGRVLEDGTKVAYVILRGSSSSGRSPSASWPNA